MPFYNPDNRLGAIFGDRKFPLKSGNNVIKSAKKEGRISKYSLPLTVIGENSGSGTTSPEAKK